MTSRLAALLTIGALLIAPACSAQTPSNIPGSGQGGYLGVAPGAAPPFAPAPQGQQLGAMPGANIGQGAGARVLRCVLDRARPLPQPGRSRSRDVRQAEPRPLPVLPPHPRSVRLAPVGRLSTLPPRSP